MFKSVKLIRVLQVLGLAVVLSLSVVLAGCGSGSSRSSDPIVGKWEMYAISMSGEFFSQTGSANVGSDGSISVTYEGKERFTGTWQAVPKNQWPQSVDVELLGMYDMTLTLIGGNTTPRTAYIMKSLEENKYILGIFYFGDNGDTFEMYFSRAM